MTNIYFSQLWRLRIQDQVLKVLDMLSFLFDLFINEILPKHACLTTIGKAAS